MLDNIATVAANDPNSTLAAEVLSEVATTATVLIHTLMTEKWISLMI